MIIKTNACKITIVGLRKFLSAVDSLHEHMNKSFDLKRFGINDETCHTSAAVTFKTLIIFTFRSSKLGKQ